MVGSYPIEGDILDSKGLEEPVRKDEKMLRKDVKTKHVVDSLKYQLEKQVKEPGANFMVYREGLMSLSCKSIHSNQRFQGPIQSKRQT